MKQSIFHILIGAGLLFGRCSKPEAPEQRRGDGVAVAFHTRVVSEEVHAQGGSARLLFWGDDEFHNQWITKSDPDVQPDFTAQLDEEINHYTYDGRIYYETSYNYPLDFSKLHATGYAPDNVLSPVDGSYTRLQVEPAARDGSVDLLTCDGCIAHSGSMNPDNSFLEEEKELLFRHLTAKITFLGERDPQMSGLVGVRNIGITIHNPEGGNRLMVPTALELYTSGADTPLNIDDDYSTYIVSQKTPYRDQSVLTHHPLIPMGETVTLGSCYVLSDGFEYGTGEGQFDPIGGEWIGTPAGQPVLRLTVRAELYNADPDDTPGFTEGTWELTIDDWKEMRTGDKFLPGYEYTVRITFNRVGIAVRAEAVPWNSEELHEYPIHPVMD